MVEKIAFKNGRISNFEGLMTLTLDRVTMHTNVNHSSTSTYMPNFIKIEEPFLWTDIRRYVYVVYTNGRTFETNFIRLTLSKSRPKTSIVCILMPKMHLHLLQTQLLSTRNSF